MDLNEYANSPHNLKIYLAVACILFAWIICSKQSFSPIRRKQIQTKLSSFLVYDQTLPTVSTKFYFTVAVTAALAWELPSEPFHKITQDFKDKLKSGELKRKDGNSTNLIYTNAANPIIYEMNKHNYYYSSPPRRNGNYNNNRIETASNYLKPNQTNFEYYLSNYLGNKNGGNSVNYYTNKLKDISEATSPLKWSRNDWMDLVKT